jgi:uncharacterized protein (DUF2267 family)
VKIEQEWVGAVSHAMGSLWTLDDAKEILTAVAPLIRAQALEEAAKLIESRVHMIGGTQATILAAAIRALIEPRAGTGESHD